MASVDPADDAAALAVERAVFLDVPPCARRGDASRIPTPRTASSTPSDRTVFASLLSRRAECTVVCQAMAQFCQLFRLGFVSRSLDGATI